MKQTSNPRAVGARVEEPRKMPRHRCDYCETTLTHDSQNARKQHNLGFKHLANVRNYYSQFQAQVDARDAPPVETSPAVAYQMQVSRVLQQQQMPPPGYGGYPPPTGMAPMGAPMGMAPMGMQAMGAPMGMQPIGRAPMGQGHPPGPPPR